MQSTRTNVRAAGHVGQQPEGGITVPGAPGKIGPVPCTSCVPGTVLPLLPNCGLDVVKVPLVAAVYSAGIRIMLLPAVTLLLKLPSMLNGK